MSAIKLVSTFLGAALLGALLPETAAAQCRSPEHCHNVGEEQQMCFDGASDFSFEECYIHQGFCQLTHPCSVTYNDLEADVNLTPAGTLVSPFGTKALGRFAGAEYRNCRNFVVLVARSSTVAPRRLILD